MLIYWFLPMILFLGIVTSYEDLKFGKIKNKWIILAVVYSLGLNSYFYLRHYYAYDYLLAFLINALISFAVGFLLWLLGMWTAGDAKLFFGFSILLPLELYHRPIITYFPSFSILFYSFIPLSALLVLFLIYKIIEKNEYTTIKKIVNFKNIMNSIFFIFGFSWFLGLILKSIGIKSNLIFLIFILLAVSQGFALLKISTLPGSILLSFTRIIFDSAIKTKIFLYEFIALATLFIVFRFAVFNLGFLYFTNNVKIKNLKPGMKLAESMVKLEKGFKKVRNIYPIKPIGGNLTFKETPSGLSKESIEELEMSAKKYGLKSIRIHQTMSFSPFLFISVLFIIFSGLQF